MTLSLISQNIAECRRHGARYEPGVVVVSLSGWEGSIAAVGTDDPAHAVRHVGDPK